MQYLTRAQIKNRVKRRLDIEDEAFIQETELNEYVEEAIDFCEAEIHKFECEDTYFEKVDDFPLTSGTQDYALPSDIYANKIRRLVHNEVNDVYTISRLRSKHRYEDAQDMELHPYSDEDHLRYMVFSNGSDGYPFIRFYPSVSRNHSVKIFYIRNAVKPSADTDEVDIPEFYNYIVQYCVVECLKKELGNPRLGLEIAKLNELKEQMTSTLSEMVPDGDDNIVPDLGIYEDMI